MSQIQSRETWRGAAVEDRQKFMATSMHVSHPAFVRAAREIKRRMHRCKNEGQGAGVLVLAPSGAGKTHLCRILKRQWNDDVSAQITKVPVVKFDIPPKPTERAMGRAMLEAMGDPAWQKGTALDALDRIRVIVPKIGTRVILIDNVQDIPEKRLDAGIRQLGTWIRSVIEVSGALVVLLGTPSARKIVYANSQLKRRMTKQLHIDYFYIDTPVDFAHFKHFLSKVCEALPLADDVNLQDDLVREIHFATFGIPDYIFQLFIEAVAFAVGDGREDLAREDFIRAFPVLHQDAVSVDGNPFSSNGPKRPLCEPGEPFENWFDSSNPSLRK